MERRHCPECGAQLRQGAQYCAECGAEVKEPTRKRPSRRAAAPRPGWPLIVLLGVGALMLIAALLIFIFTQQPDVDLVAEPAGDSMGQVVTANPNAPFPAVPRMTIDQARELYNSGDVIFVDTRGAQSYEQAHIPGAVTLPEATTSDAYLELPRDVPVVTYCTWPSEESSARVAQYMMDNGYSNVSALLGGFAAWQQAGYPLESGE